MSNQRTATNPSLKDLIAPRLTIAGTPSPGTTIAEIEEITSFINNQMLVNELILQQIKELREKPQTDANYQALSDRVTQLEAGMKTVSTAVTQLTAAISKLPSQQSVDAAIAQLAKKSIYVESAYSPDTIDAGTNPDWRVWLQEGVKDGRSYAALFVRSTARNAAVKVWESIGAIVATTNQDQTKTYTGIPGVNVRYTTTRSSDQAYSVWITATDALVDSQVNWVAIDEQNKESDRGIISSVNGEIHQFYPRFPVRSIRLEFDWVNDTKPNDSYTFGVF